MGLEDAIVEDTFWWCCPECETIQTSVCGDAMICRQCDIEFEPDHFDFEASNKIIDSGWLDSEGE